jgi:RepB DNA-primase from phage plasmid
MASNKEKKPQRGGARASVEVPSATKRRDPTPPRRDTLDPSEAARFLTALDPAATFFTFQTFDDNRDRKSKSLVRVLHGTLDEHWDTLARLNDQGAGIFVTVNETDGKGRTAKNIVKVRSLFLDLDGAPLEPVLANGRTPHIVVESSSARWHTYWRVADMPLDQFSGLQKSLIEQFDGDKAIHDLPRVMRLPGFMHRKGEPFLSRIVSTSGETPLYTVADFPQVEKKATAKPKKPTDRSAQDQSKWHKLNSAALAKLEAWVPELFSEAKPYHDGYRVTSASLGRDLEEDLSLTPQGIKDFGVHDLGDKREGKRTPIDVVMEWGGKNLVEASIWLRTRLGLPEEGVSLEDFRAYMPMHNYFFTPSREPWPASSVNARLGKITLLDSNGNPLLDNEGEPETIPASMWLDLNRPVEQVTWAPGEPMLVRDRLIVEAGWIERAGVACLNLYRPPTIVPGDPTAAGMWTDLVYKVFSKDQSRPGNRQRRPRHR